MAILRRNCPHCPAEHVAFELVYSGTLPQQMLPHIWNCCARCGACNKPIAFVATSIQKSQQSPMQFNGDIEQAWSVPTIWPTRADPNAPPYTPPHVARRFLEGEDAFSRRKWNSAVAMYRSALDIATKSMDGVPDKATFFERLRWLHDNHGITPNIWSWATHVRVEGNAALHDPEEFEADDAKALRFFTEMFLRYIFELPGAVREFRGETVLGA
jgi:hypothetical protein